MNLPLSLRIAYRSLTFPFRAPRMRRFYSQFIQPGNLVFDIGANHGERTAVFLSLGARVVAVEPDPRCFRALIRRFAGNPRITILPYAVSDHIGVENLYLGSTDTLSTISEKWIDAVTDSARFPGESWSEDSIPVHSTTLSHLIASQGWPDFIKIDTEGSEWEITKDLSVCIPALSFEFVPERIDIALLIIKHLASLGMTKFNYTIEDSNIMFPISDIPVTSLHFIPALKKCVDMQIIHQPSWGDIYAFTPKG